MKTLILVALIGVSACSPQGEVWVIEGLRIQAPTELIEQGYTFRANYTERDIVLARKLIDKRYGEGSFARLARNITIEIRNEFWRCEPFSPPEHECTGQFMGGPDAKILTYYGTAIVHEFIHAKEASELNFGTMSHEGWDTDGQNTLSNEYDLSKDFHPWIARYN